MLVIFYGKFVVVAELKVVNTGIGNKGRGKYMLGVKSRGRTRYVSI